MMMVVVMVIMVIITLPYIRSLVGQRLLQIKSYYYEGGNVAVIFKKKSDQNVFLRPLLVT